MSFLIIIVSLAIVGVFWRQILKGGLISLIILLGAITFLFSFVLAEEKSSEIRCYERDHRFDEKVEFFAEGYKIIVSNHPQGDIKDCASDHDYIKIFEPSGNKVFELKSDEWWAQHDFLPRFIINYSDDSSKEYLKDLYDQLKILEPDWKYYITTEWRGSCGGCETFHQISFKNGFKYHGKIYLHPATFAVYNTAYIEKTDINENIIYAYKLGKDDKKWEKISSIDNYLEKKFHENNQ